MELSTTANIILSDNEKAFIHASKYKAGKQRRIRRMTLATLVVLTILSSVLTVFSFNALNVAENKRSEAEDLLGFMVGEFADKLRKVKRMDLLDGINQKATQYFTKQNQNEGVLRWVTSKQQLFNAQFKKAQTLQGIAEVDYSRGRIEDAKIGLIEAQETFNELIKIHVDNVNLLKSTGANAFWQGRIEYDEGNFNTAKEYFDLYLELSEKMHAISPHNPTVKVELSYALSTLGALHANTENYKTAKQLFLEALEHIESLLSTSKNPSDLLIDKADILTWLAQISNHLGNINEAINGHKQAENVITTLVTLSQANANSIETLMYSYWHQADLLIFKNNYEDAINKLKQAENALNELIEKDPQNYIWKENLDEISSFITIYTTRENKLLNKPFSAYLPPIQVYLDDPTFLPSKLTNTIIAEYQNNKKFADSALLIQKIDAVINSIETAQIAKIDIANFYLIKSKQYRSTGNTEKRYEQCEVAKNIIASLLEKSANIEFMASYVVAEQCLNDNSTDTPYMSILKEMNVTNLNIY